MALCESTRGAAIVQENRDDCFDFSDSSLSISLTMKFLFPA